MNESSATVVAILGLFVLIGGALFVNAQNPTINEAVNDVDHGRYRVVNATARRCVVVDVVDERDGSVKQMAVFDKHARLVND